MGDWYWFYAALHEQLRHRKAGNSCHWPQVVSNDLMRDHHWRMMETGTFLAWMERHVTRYHCWFERELNDEFQFQWEEPLTFSTRSQRIGDEWHFPIAVAQPKVEDAVPDSDAVQPTGDDSAKDVPKDAP